MIYSLGFRDLSLPVNASITYGLAKFEHCVDTLHESFETSGPFALQFSVHSCVDNTLLFY